MRDYILSVAQELFDDKRCVDIDEIAATAGVKTSVVRTYLSGTDATGAPLGRVSMSTSPVISTVRVR